MSTNDIGKRKLRLAMIGGGPGALIGEVHRKAARLDGRIELVAGAFSSHPEKSRQQGRELFLDPERVYASWREMLKAEAALSAERRVDAVAIVTPNHLHFEQSAAALAAGFHVIQDKPLTLNLAEAVELREAVRKSGKIFALTHTYTGYPMVKLARDLIRAGRLGKLRKIVAEYPQGWLFRKVEDDPGNKRASWRTDPAQAGSGCLGDIGTHIANLSETVSSLKIREIAANVSTMVEGRKNDDNADILARWEGNVSGVIRASQVETGEDNDIGIRVYGDAASLQWRHGDPERLLLRYPDKPMETWSRGQPYVAAASPSAARATRLPACHPEGIIEAFANIYLNAAAAIAAAEAGTPIPEAELDFPTIEDGFQGILFVEAALASAKNGGRWTKLARG
ncbi:MAG: Gfo/Idh/MocA family oxidoreductase [Planctomycetota bacterium]|jgi:predicted dehydrogenase|nr:Gfo/Idh/MocA family oxidoreductase [Planctomycetota bacterium]